MYSCTVRAITKRALHSSRFLRTLSVFLGLHALLPVTCQLAAQTPPDIDRIVSSAAAARDRGDLSQAIALYQQAEQLNPKWPDGWWYIGTLRYGANDYAPAITALDHYIALMPKAGPAYALRGLCEFELAQYAPSLQDLQTGVALGAASQPRNAAIIVYHEGLTLARLGRFEEALSQYSQIAKHSSVDRDLILAVGLAGLRTTTLPKDIDPSQAELVSAAGHAATEYMAGDLAGADRDFQSLFAHYASTPDIHYLYGYLLFPTDPQGGVAQFKDELSVSPTSAVTHAMLAWAYSLQADFTAALPNAQKAAAEDPSLPMAQLVLGRALVETGDAAAGLPHLEAVLSSDPQNLEAHLALVKAYSKLGRNQDARQERLLCLEISGQEAGGDASM
jgi:tetratricopeptide (TPR) repeat protein